jgi:hypothetical protein
MYFYDFGKHLPTEVSDLIMNSRSRITWIINFIGRAAIPPAHPTGKAQSKTTRINKTSPKVQP